MEAQNQRQGNTVLIIVPGTWILPQTWFCSGREAQHNRNLSPGQRLHRLWAFLIREGEGQGWKGRRLETSVPWGEGYEKKNKKQALKYRVGGAVSVLISLLQPHGGGHSTPPLEEGQKEERVGATCYCQPAACSWVRETPGRRESSSSGTKAYSHSSCKCSPGGSLHWTIPATGPCVKQRRWQCSLQWAKTLAQWYSSWSA